MGRKGILICVAAVAVFALSGGRITRSSCRRSPSTTRRAVAPPGRCTSRRRAATTENTASTSICSSACIPPGIAMLTSGQAVMVNHSLEQGWWRARKTRTRFALLGSSSNKGLFALVGQKEFSNPKQLKGKRIAVGQIGDAPYNYTSRSSARTGSACGTWNGFPSAPTSRPRRGAADEPRRRNAPGPRRTTSASKRQATKCWRTSPSARCIAATVYLFAGRRWPRRPKLGESIIKAHA